MENDILKFDLSPKQLKFKDILNKEFIELEIWAISTINPNRNNSHFTLESLMDAKPNCKNKPIVGFFENNDFTTHEGKADYDPELKKEFWNTERGERILGWIRESDPVEIVEEGGLNWLKFRCVLCTTYCYRQVRRLLKDKRKKVSVEITVKEHHFVNDIEVIDKFVLNGVTILGSKNGKAVLEGIPGAHLSILEKLDEDAMMEQKRVLTFAYKQFDGACCETKEDKLVKDMIGLGEENTKKEVNQADMDNIEKNCDNVEVYGVNIKVDKSKDAMSEKPWGEVDKTELRRKVVEADNFKTVAGDIFLDLREGWEDGEVSKLKYPVMEIKSDNTAVYNRGALASAKAYAEQHDEKEVLAKVNKIYKDLDLNDSYEDKEKACKMAADCKEDYCDDCGCEEGEDKNYSEEHGPDCECPDCKADKEQEACDNGGPVAEKESCEKPAAEQEAVIVEEITPDVAVVTETEEEINENKEELTMEDINVDLGIPQCEGDPSAAEIHDGEEVLVDAEAPEALMPEGGMGAIIANDEGKAEITIIPDEDGKDKGDINVACDPISKECDNFTKEFEDLKVRCHSLEETLAAKDEVIAGYEAKIATYADYDEIKKNLEAAESKLFAYHCAELKATAVGLMADENIKDEYYSSIVTKCEKGEYGCEEDIKKDIAIAIYSSRPAQEKRFSVSIPVVEAPKAKTVEKPNTPAARLQNYVNKK